MTIRDKPWGYEEILVANGHYTLKYLTLNPYSRISLQYHDEKHETLILISGEARLTLGNIDEYHDIDMEFEVPYEIPPDIVHRITNTRGFQACVMEVSTPECGVTVRLEDDYGRSDEVFPL